MNKKTYLSFLFFFFSTSLFAYDLNIGIGNNSEFVGLIQTDENGTLGVLSFNPYFIISSDVPIEKTSFLIAPELAASLPQSGRDKNTKRFHFHALLNGKYKFTKAYLLAGTGLYFSSVYGNGGEENLNNGVGTTSFPLPDKHSVARNLILNLGTGYQFNEELHGEIHTFIFNIENSEDRAFSLLVNLNYHLGDIL